MKKIVIGLLAVVMSIFALSSSAEEGVTYDGKNIALTSVSVASSSDGRKFNAKDLQNGVYIKLAPYFFGSELPNASELIRQRFAELGFKVNKEMEGSDMALLFDAQGSMDMSNAEAKAAHSRAPNAVNIGGAVAAGVVAGIPGVLAFASGGLFPTDSRTTLNAMVLLKPNKNKSTVDGGTFTNGVTVKYKLEKGNEATEDLVLKMLVDQWVKLYIVADAPAANSAQAAKVADGANVK